MKSTIKNNDTKALKFPALYIFKEDQARSVGLVILMRTEFSGIILSQACHTNFLIGDHVDKIADFNLDDYILFSGQVVLEN